MYFISLFLTESRPFLPGPAVRSKWRLMPSADVRPVSSSLVMRMYSLMYCQT